jgi:hypothetical protein
MQKRFFAITQLLHGISILGLSHCISQSNWEHSQSFDLKRILYLRENQAVISTISNGQVEGQVNKLKTIKRNMYGRAGFGLLRQMVLISSG